MRKILSLILLSSIALSGIVLNTIYYDTYFLDANYGIKLSIFLSIAFIVFESALWIYSNRKWYLNILKFSMVLFSILVTLSSQFSSTSIKESLTAAVIFEKTDVSGDVNYYRDRIAILDNRIDENINQQLVFGSEKNRTERENAEFEKKRLEAKLENVTIKKQDDIETINKPKSIYFWFSNELPGIVNGEVNENFIRICFQLFSSIILALMAPICLTMIKGFPDSKKKRVHKTKPEKLKINIPDMFNKYKRNGLDKTDINNIITVFLWTSSREETVKILSPLEVQEKYKKLHENRTEYRAYTEKECQLVYNDLINQGLDKIYFKDAIEKFKMEGMI
jgi:hypothetical protein